MGYDVTFHLVDAEAIRRELLEPLLKGGAAPAPFDTDPAKWAAARETVLHGPASQAAHEACRLAIEFSAARLPHLYRRNFAVTYHPMRMEDELRGIPSMDFGSPEKVLFQPLIEARPALRGCLPSELEGNYRTGGFCSSPWSAANAMRAFCNELSPNFRRRVRPLLGLLRAAVRHRLCVWEASDLAGVTPTRPELLHCPELGRSIDLAPSREEWEKLAKGVADEGDVLDLVDCIVETEPLTDRAASLAMLTFLGTLSASNWLSLDPKVLGLLRAWLDVAIRDEALTLASFRPLYSVLLGSGQGSSPRHLLPPSIVNKGLMAEDPLVVSSVVALLDTITDNTDGLEEGLIRAWIRLREAGDALLAEVLMLVGRHAATQALNTVLGGGHAPDPGFISDIVYLMEYADPYEIVATHHGALLALVEAASSTSDSGIASASKDLQRMLERCREENDEI